MPDKTVVFRPRLRAEVDAKLRDLIYRRGELLKLIILILKTVDLSTIPLLEMSDDFKSFASTTVKLPAALHAKLKYIAEERRSSMNALVNSAVWAYKDEPPPEDEV